MMSEEDKQIKEQTTDVSKHEGQTEKRHETSVSSADLRKRQSGEKKKTEDTQTTEKEGRKYVTACSDAETLDMGSDGDKPNARAILAAVVTRVFFMGHVAVAVWRTVSVSGSLAWWTLIAILAFQVVEMAIILWKRRGHEWRHFCWAVFIYLLGSVPCVWVIEIHRLDNLRAGIHEENATTTLYGLPHDIALTETEWAIAIEQTMMCLLIIGRWLLPKGDLTRDQLSQVLLVYLGLAADIVELFEIFQISTVVDDPDFIIIVLAAYSWSLWQFTFVITTSEEELVRGTTPDRCRGCNKSCQTNPFCDAEVFSIIASMVFQDGPFFGVRLCAIILYQVVSYSNYFFTVKNALFMVLQSYRLLIITCPCCHDKKPEEAKPELMDFDKARKNQVTPEKKGLAEINL